MLSRFFIIANELNPIFNELLPFEIGRMCLPCKDNLNGALRVGQNAQKSLRIMEEKVWPFIRDKSTGKPQSESFWVKAMPRKIDQSLASDLAHLPEFFIGNFLDFLFQLFCLVEPP